MQSCLFQVYLIPSSSFQVNGLFPNEEFSRKQKKTNKIFPTKVENTLAQCLHPALSDFLSETSLIGGSSPCLWRTEQQSQYQC